MSDATRRRGPIDTFAKRTSKIVPSEGRPQTVTEKADPTAKGPQLDLFWEPSDSPDEWFQAS